MTIDTLSIAKDLKAAELPAEQAEAIAAAIGRSISEGSATKADVQLVKQELQGELVLVRAELKTGVEQLRTEIERMRNQVMVGVFGIIAALAGIIIEIVRL